MEPIDETLIVLSSIQTFIIFFVLIIVLLILLRIRQIGLLIGKPKTGRVFNEPKADFEVVVHKSGDNCDLDLKSDRKSLYHTNRQKNVLKANESFQTKASKTSDGLESVPIQQLSPQLSTISSGKQVTEQVMAQLNARFGRHTDEECNVRQSSDNSILSDTMAKIDDIIDKTFDSIIDSIENIDNSSDEE